MKPSSSASRLSTFCTMCVTVSECASVCCMCKCSSEKTDHCNISCRQPKWHHISCKYVVYWDLKDSLSCIAVKKHIPASLERLDTQKEWKVEQWGYLIRNLKVPEQPTGVLWYGLGNSDVRWGKIRHGGQGLNEASGFLLAQSNPRTPT